MIHCESSAEVWLSLENLYACQTITKSFQLKQKLQSIKKDDLSINDYILKIKTIDHALAAIGKPLTDKDLLFAILNGLDQEYETIASLVTYQMDETDLEKVQYLLLMHKLRLSIKNSSSSSSMATFDSLNFGMHAHVANIANVPAQNSTGFGNSSRGGNTMRGTSYMNRGGRGRG